MRAVIGLVSREAEGITRRCAAVVQELKVLYSGVTYELWAEWAILGTIIVSSNLRVAKAYITLQLQRQGLIVRSWIEHR